MANEKSTPRQSGAPRNKKVLTRAELEDIVAVAELRAREAEALVRQTEANSKLRKLKSEKKGPRAGA